MPSTTWEWRRVKIAPAPQANKHSPAKPARWYRLSRWDPRNPLTIKVKYRGGPEAWYEVHARGRVGRFPGSVALHDVMREIHQER